MCCHSEDRDNQRIEIMEINEKLQEIHENIVKEVIKLEYSTKEMLKCVEIVEENNRLIKKSIRSRKEMIALKGTVKNIIEEVFMESRKSPRLDKIVQQAAQAMFEGLSSPETIVRYFWPYPHS